MFEADVLQVDIICAPDGTQMVCDEEGAPRRPGGLGDFLSGSTAVILAWTVNSKAEQNEAASYHDKVQACHAACTLVRQACKSAFAEHKRSMVAPDVLNHMGRTFERLCPAL